LNVRCVAEACCVIGLKCDVRVVNLRIELIDM
jgi:hypothetical protein